MIGTRVGAALALALSVVAVVLAVAALMTALGEEDEAAVGRLVSTRLVASESAPVLFPLDDFYASTGEDGRLYALYVYPPGYFGHARGCKVVWVADAAGADAARPGAFVDPCGGARFARDGRLIEGEAERGLDRFRTEPSIDGIIVDTRTLYCGPAFGGIALTPSEGTGAVTPPAASLTPGAEMATITITVTATPALTATAASQRETLEECDRVAADTE